MVSTDRYNFKDSEDSEIKYSINVLPVAPFCFSGKKSMFKTNNKGLDTLKTRH